MRRFCLNTNKMKPKLQTSPITIIVFGTLTGVIFLSIYVRFERGGNSAYWPKFKRKIQKNIYFHLFIHLFSCSNLPYANPSAKTRNFCLEKIVIKSYFFTLTRFFYILATGVNRPKIHTCP